MQIQFADSLPLCPKFQPAVDVRCATPDLDGCLHRFFDTSPHQPVRTLSSRNPFSMRKPFARAGRNGRGGRR